MFPKPLYSLAAALLAAPMVHGHYIFSQLLVNGAAQGADYDYIRKNTNSYMPSFTADVINSEDLRCNQGALSATAKTMDVKAGDEIGAKLSFNEFIEHPGPGMIYMSKAPGSVADYKGDGDWFKVWESGPDNGPANVDVLGHLAEGEHVLHHPQGPSRRRVPGSLRARCHPREPRRQVAILHGVRPAERQRWRYRYSWPHGPDPRCLHR
jgi:hypothetical protein